jgi:hypothetical protein
MALRMIQPSSWAANAICQGSPISDAAGSPHSHQPDDDVPLLLLDGESLGEMAIPQRQSKSATHRHLLARIPWDLEILQCHVLGGIRS